MAGEYPQDIPRGLVRFLSRWEEARVRTSRAHIAREQKNLQDALNRLGAVAAEAQTLAYRLTQLRSLIDRERVFLEQEAERLRALPGVRAGRAVDEGIILWYEPAGGPHAVFLSPVGEVAWVGHDGMRSAIARPTSSLVGAMLRARRLCLAINLVLEQQLDEDEPPLPPPFPDPIWPAACTNQIIMLWSRPLAEEALAVNRRLAEAKGEEVALERTAQEVETRLGKYDCRYGNKGTAGFFPACRRSWATLTAHPMVDHIDAPTEGDRIVVRTRSIRVPFGASLYTLGCYRLVVDAVELRLSVRREVQSLGDYDHPHVTRGTLCLGSGARAAAEAMRDGDVVTLLCLALDVLQSYNPSSAYCRIERWPREERSGA